MRSRYKDDIVEKEKITYIVRFVRSTENRVDYAVKEYESGSLQVSLYGLLMIYIIYILCYIYNIYIHCDVRMVD